MISQDWKHLIKKSVAQVRLRGANRVLLTFDDGPDPEGTPTALRLLKQYHARAVFFVVGQRVARVPDLLRSIVEEGHLIGNHSFQHPNYKRLSFAAYLEDVAKCQRCVEEVIGARPTLFRPPHGLFSPTTILVPKLLGLTTLLWSIDAQDWGLGNVSDAEQAAERLRGSVLSSKRLNDIILLHDDHPYLGTILGSILPTLAAQGCDLYSGVEGIR